MKCPYCLQNIYMADWSNHSLVCEDKKALLDPNFVKSPKPEAETVQDAPGHEKTGGTDDETAVKVNLPAMTEKAAELMEERGISPGSVIGTGNDGKILHSDVLDYMDYKNAGGE